jgi:hypothetical protein
MTLPPFFDLQKQFPGSLSTFFDSTLLSFEAFFFSLGLGFACLEGCLDSDKRSAIFSCHSLYITNEIVINFLLSRKVKFEMLQSFNNFYCKENGRNITFKLGAAQNLQS